MLLAIVLLSLRPAWAADAHATIRAYYNCGMAKYLPGSGSFISEEDEVRAATYLLTNRCAKEYEALKNDLVSFEKERLRLEEAMKERLLTPFSASETLEGHKEHARDQVRLLMRLDRFAACWSSKAAEYARALEEPVDTILDAAVVGCGKERSSLREMIKAVYIKDVDEQLESSVQIARQHASKAVLDEKLKRARR